jgi:hypothetical protein
VASAFREKQKLDTKGIEYPETVSKKSAFSFSNFFVIAPRTYLGSTALGIRVSQPLLSQSANHERKFSPVILILSARKLK